MSGRYNGLYGAGDALDMLPAVWDGGWYAPTAAARLRGGGGGGGGGRRGLGTKGYKHLCHDYQTLLQFAVLRN